MSETIALSPTPVVTRAPGRAAPLIALGLALGALWFILCRHLSEEWRFNEQYSYGWFVPFFALYLFWLRWEDRPGKSQKWKVESRKGRALFVIAAASLILLPLRVFEIASSDYRPLGWLHALAAVAITLSILYLIGGEPWLRHFAFPVLFFLTAVPWVSAIEAPVIEGLMRGIASLAAETLSLFGVPIQAQGNLLRLPSGTVGVNEACSGVRSLQTSIMIGLLFGELKRLGAWPRLWLVAAAVAIALFANFLRVLFLVSLASSAHNVSAVDRWHDLAGYAILLLVFAGTMGTAMKLESRNEKVESRNAKAENTDPSASSTFHFLSSTSPLLLSTFYLLLCLWFFAIEAGAEMWYRAHERNLVASPAWSIRWPENAPGFREIKPDERVRELLRYDAGREAVWRSSDRPETDYLFFFRWNPGSGTILRARSHRPDICLPSAGWHQLGDDKLETFALPHDRSLAFRRFTFAPEGSTGPAMRAHAYYCLHEDSTHQAEAGANEAAGLYSNWDLRDRWRVVRSGIRNLGQQVMEVIILAPRDEDDAAVDARFHELLKQLVH